MRLVQWKSEEKSTEWKRQKRVGDMKHNLALGAFLNASSWAYHAMYNVAVEHFKIWIEIFSLPMEFLTLKYFSPPRLLITCCMFTFSSIRRNGNDASLVICHVLMLNIKFSFTTVEGIEMKRFMQRKASLLMSPTKSLMKLFIEAIYATE